MLFYRETEDKLEHTEVPSNKNKLCSFYCGKLVSFNSEQHQLGRRESTERFVKEHMLYTYAKFKPGKLRLKFQKSGH